MPASLRGIYVNPSADSERGRFAYRSAGPGRGGRLAVLHSQVIGSQGLQPGQPVSGSCAIIAALYRTEL
jgi:hypothetical protein